jgi:hypothetical protein
MVKIAPPRPPRRLLRKNRKAAAPKILPLPPVDRLRRAVEAINPAARYRHVLPDGQVFEATGAELLETAGMMLAMADARESGDQAAFAKAAIAFLRAGG